jgi:LuxR family maltose regulon positive regulatory protein
MVSNFILSKYHVPALTAIQLPRIHLIGALEHSAVSGSRLFLISAPAGFGKTSLLLNWIYSPSSKKRHFAWVSLDKEDNQTGNFLNYLILGLQTIQPEWGQDLLDALQSNEPPEQAISQATLSNLFHKLPENSYLVLDDLHSIENPKIHQMLQTWLEQLPANLHFVFLSRNDPPISLARLRANGLLNEIRVDDLRFSIEETGQFLQQMNQLPLSPESTQLLHDKTEGWIAGLHMASLALKPTGMRPLPQDCEDFVRRFNGSHRFVLDYLIEEVLKNQPEDIRQFLLQTSILDQFNASLCDTLLEIKNSQQTLELLEQTNAFLFPLDQERQWYRYHHLFADLLRSQLTRFQPEQLVILHQKASRWFEKNNYYHQAINHAFLTKDDVLVIEILENHGTHFLLIGEIKPLLAWLDRLPSYEMDKHLWLLTLRAWCLLLSAQTSPIPDLLCRIENAWAAQSNPQKIDPTGHIAVIRAYLAALSGNLGIIYQQAHLALKVSPEDPIITSMASFSLGSYYLLQGNFVEAQKAFWQAAQIGLASGNMHIVIPASAAAASQFVLLGNLDQALISFQEIEKNSLRNGRPTPLTARAYSGLSSIYYEKNDLDKAFFYAQEGSRLCEQWGNKDTLASCLTSQAKCLLARQNYAEAERFISQAENILKTSSLTSGLFQTISAARLKLWLAKGEPQKVIFWANEHKNALSDDFMQDELVLLVNYAVFLTSQKAPQSSTIKDVHAQFQRIQKSAQNSQRIGRWIQANILLALFEHQLGRPAQTDQYLLDALDKAASQQYIQTFLEFGPPLQSLLIRLSPAKTLRPYLNLLLQAFSSPISSYSPDVLEEPLTDRELEILQYLANGLSNQEICNKLVLSLGTVKAHTSNIYGKLGVRNRTEAVLKAQNLGLIS